MHFCSTRNQQLRTQLRLEVSELSRGEMIAEKDVNVNSDEVDHRQEPLSPTKSVSQLDFYAFCCIFSLQNK